MSTESRPSASHRPRLRHDRHCTLELERAVPLLKNNGCCVFALNYGRLIPLLPTNGLKPLADSAEELARFVDRVLDATGASQVDMVGHSQGGVLPRY